MGINASANARQAVAETRHALKEAAERFLAAFDTAEESNLAEGLHEAATTHNISLRSVWQLGHGKQPHCAKCNAPIHYESFTGAWLHSGEGNDDHNVE